MASKKKKQCKKGFDCGRTCINKKRTCRSNLGPTGKKLVENYAQFVERISKQKAAASPPKEDAKFTVSFSPDSTLLEGEKDLIRRTKLDLSTMNDPVENLKDKVSSNGVKKASPEEIETLRSSLSEVSSNKDVKYSLDLEEDFHLDFPEADKRSRDLLSKYSNDTNLYVSWYPTLETDKEIREAKESGDLSKADRIGKRVALSAARMWKKDIFPRIPDGTIISNSPFGNSLGSRAKAYMRQGFGVVGGDGEQFAIKIDGKLEPLNLVKPDQVLIDQFGGNPNPKKAKNLRNNEYIPEEDEEVVIEPDNTMEDLQDLYDVEPDPNFVNELEDDLTTDDFDPNDPWKGLL